jgi:hypothetical protein
MLPLLLPLPPLLLLLLLLLLRTCLGAGGPQRCSCSMHTTRHEGSPGSAAGTVQHRFSTNKRAFAVQQPTR